MFTETKSLPQPLTALYNEQYLNIGFQELLQQAERVFNELKISAEEAEAVEESTTDQSSSKQWFEHRAGRITDSKFHTACSTNPDKPSHSLIKVICYPESHRFSNAATKWGL